MHRVNVCVVDTNTYVHVQSHYFTTTLYIDQCLYHLYVVDYCLIWSLPTCTTHSHIVPHCATYKRRPHCKVNTQRGCFLPACVESVQGSLEGEEEDIQTERVQRAGMPYTNLNTYTQKYTLISHQPLSRTQLTWGNSHGRRAHREAARWILLVLYLLVLYIPVYSLYPLFLYHCKMLTYSIPTYMLIYVFTTLLHFLTIKNELIIK